MPVINVLNESANGHIRNWIGCICEIYIFENIYPSENLIHAIKVT